MMVGGREEMAVDCEGQVHMDESTEMHEPSTIERKEASIEEILPWYVNYVIRLFTYYMMCFHLQPLLADEDSNGQECSV